MSDSVRPQRRQPTRLPHPWDSPGKNTGVGCHFLLQCMKVKSESEVAQSCPTLSDPMDCSLPGSSVHGIFQARVLEWGAIAFSDCHTSFSLFAENFLANPIFIIYTKMMFIIHTLTCLSEKCITMKDSVQFSRSVVSYSLRPPDSQHARPPCPSPTPGVHPDSCPLSQ